MPGVQFIVIPVGEAVPVHVCGPVTVSLPSLVSEALNLSKGALNVRLQPFCVTTIGEPTSVLSQCCVTFQLPETVGHAGVAPLEPLLPVLPEEDDELESLELHAVTAKRTLARTTKTRMRLRYHAAARFSV